MSAKGAIHRRDKRSRTGCVGISLTLNRRTEGVRHYFQVCRGRGGNRRWCIETLGRAEAWRRAVEARAAYERTFTLGGLRVLAAPTPKGGAA